MVAFSFARPARSPCSHLGDRLELDGIAFKREAFMATVNALTEHIEITPGVRGGRPRIAGRRITVSDIVIMHLRVGRSVDEIAAECDLALSDVHAALAYYYDHREEIEQGIEADRAFVEAFREENPSLLRERLKALRGD